MFTASFLITKKRLANVDIKCADIVLKTQLEFKSLFSVLYSRIISWCFYLLNY